MKDYQLTSKGTRALDNMRIELPASAARFQNNRQTQMMMLHVLTMIKNGAGEDEMIEEFASSISYQRGASPTAGAPEVAVLLGGIIRMLEVTDHITISEDEEPPEFMSDFKDHF